MGILARGMAFLGRVGAESNSETVTYKRAGQSFTVAAVIGGQGFEQEEGSGIPARLAKRDRDFIIRVADFATAYTAAGMAAFTPTVGDLITQGSRSFRVYSDGAIPAWDYGEPEEISYRIHTRAEP